MTTPYDLQAGELRRDGTRPFVTFYDDATGERVELSVATFDNWVAKTAGLLRDGLSVEPGDRVALLLPPHWQSLVWAAACWALGACVVLDRTDEVAVAVTGPSTLDAATTAGEVVALSLQPMGARFSAPLPAGVLDYAVEVPSYPDRIELAPPHPSEPAVDDVGAVQTLDGLVARATDRAARLSIAAGARVLVTADHVRGALNDALLLPLVVGGSSVLVRHENPGRRDSRVAAERATAVAPTS
ncbi:MAG: TIGR03089 family protein [Jiangellaceae bacterium]